MTRIDMISKARKRRMKMRELYEQGWSLAKIGRQYNCSRQRVWQIFQEEKERPA